MPLKTCYVCVFPTSSTVLYPLRTDTQELWVHPVYILYFIHFYIMFPATTLLSSLTFYAWNSLQTIGQIALPAAIFCHPYCPGISFINPFQSLCFSQLSCRQPANCHTKCHICNIFSPFPFENRASVSFPLLPFTHQPMDQFSQTAENMPYPVACKKVTTSLQIAKFFSFSQYRLKGMLGQKIKLFKHKINKCVSLIFRFHG
jgi:hypothetical protein